MIVFCACMKNEDFNQNLILKPFWLRLCQKSSQTKMNAMFELFAIICITNEGFEHTYSDTPSCVAMECLTE